MGNVQYLVLCDNQAVNLRFMPYSVHMLNLTLITKTKDMWLLKSTSHKLKP